MRILIIGAGAIGGITGGYLTQAGEDVVLVDRVEDHVSAMQQHGLLIDGIPGELRVPVTAVMPDHLTGTFDIVLIAVKSQHTESALSLIPPHLSDSGFVVSLQNGLGNKPLVAATVGAERTLGAMVRLGGGYRGPGHISHITQGLFVVGELNGQLTPRLEQLRQLLDNVAPTKSTDNLFGWLWAKETYGSLITLLSLVDATFSEVLALPGAEQLAIRAMRECALVARAEGVRLEAFDFLDPNALLGNTSADHARVRQDLNTIRERFGHIKSGIWRDIVVRRIPTEVPFALGEVVRRAELADVPVPLLGQVYQMMIDIEHGERAMSPSNLDQLAASLVSVTPQQ